MRLRAGVRFTNSALAAQLLVFAEQRLVLAQFRPELRHLRLVLVVGGAQLGRVHHVVQVVDHAPGTAQAFGRFLERDHEAVPADRRQALRSLPGHGARVRDQLLDRRRHMLGTDQVEAGQARKVEEGIAGVGRHVRVLIFQGFMPSYYPGYGLSPRPAQATFSATRSADSSVFISSIVIVIGPTPPGTGVMCEATSLDAVEVDVAAQLAFVVAVDADVDHDGARLDHVAGQVLRRPTAATTTSAWRVW
jgi:hypothetical protein